MSLRVWLPLNGTLDNQGLDDIVVTNNGATIDNSGKIGKCYYFNGSSYLSIPIDFSTFSTTECSMCVWAKMPDPTSGNKQLLHIGKGSGWTNNRFTLLYRTGSAQVVSSISDGTNYLAYNCNASIVANEWIHLAVVFGNRQLKIYVNGELKTNYSTTFDISFNSITALGVGAAPNGNEKYTGYLNDVRIYDHALSPMEVKQISQGLILHYPLNRGGFGQENLITQAMIDADPWKSAIQGTYTIDGKMGWILNNNLLYSKSGNGANNIFSGLTYDTNTQYTISFKWRDDYRTDGKSSSLYIRFKYSDGTYSQVISSQDYNYWKEEVMISTVGKTITAITTTYGNGGNLLFTDLKLEKGTIKTPTSPIVNSDLYNSMNLNGIIEYDCSGYENNGIKVGIFDYDSDTPRYNVSTKIAASATGIKLTNFSIGNIWSMSVWFKYPSQDNTGWKALVILNNSGSDSDLQFGNYINCNDGRIQYSANGKYNSSSVHLIFGEWNHLVSTYDGTTLRCYFNGEYKASLTPGQTLSNKSNLGVGFKSNAVDFSTFGASMTNGLLSDVRVYATTLSADDVKSLYNNSAYIDNQGNIYGAVYEEV